MRYFNENVDKYLAGWILPDTWDSAHPLDKGRFYHFVKALHHYNVKCNKNEIKEKIINAIKSNHPNLEKEANDIATLYAQKADVVIEYLWISSVTQDNEVPDKELESWDAPLM